MRPSRGCAPSRFFEKGPSRTSASRDLFKRQIAGTVIRMGSSVARTLLSANPGSTHPQPSPKPRHPERSRAIREANGPAKSKDPYSLPISKPSELRRGSRPSGRNFDPLAPARSCTFQWKEKQQSNKWSKSSIPGPAHCRVALIQAKKRLEGAKISKKKPEKLIPP